MNGPPPAGYDLWCLSRLLVGETLNGEVEAVHGPLRAIVEHLNGLKKASRPVAWRGFLAGRLDGEELEARLAEIDPEGPAPEIVEGEEPQGFSLGLVSTRDFFAESFRLEWLARGILVKDQPCVFGGPQKSLKTSILIDLVISLGSGTPFLGRFSIPEPVPVALVSGESGKAVIQASAKRVCEARGIPGAMADRVRWGFVLPQLCNPEHIKAVGREIEAIGLKVIVFDPLYLALLAGNTEINPADMFQMGPLLARIAEACLERGCTPVLAHHFTKRREDPFGPPDMGELAYAGIGQFMRQWMLTARRERYNPESGIHRLYFSFGGSAGHSGELHLDIDSGTIGDDFTGRKWDVTVSNPMESRAVRAEEQLAEAERKRAETERRKVESRDRDEREAMVEVAKLLRKEPGRKATPKRIFNLTGWNRSKVDRILALLERDKFVRPADVEVPMGRGRVGTYPGVELIDDLEGLS